MEKERLHPHEVGKTEYIEKLIAEQQKLINIYGAREVEMAYIEAVNRPSQNIKQGHNLDNLQASPETPAREQSTNIDIASQDEAGASNQPDTERPLERPLSEKLDLLDATYRLRASGQLETREVSIIQLRGLLEALADFLPPELEKIKIGMSLDNLRKETNFNAPFAFKFMDTILYTDAGDYFPKDYEHRDEILLDFQHLQQQSINELNNKGIERVGSTHKEEPDYVRPGWGGYIFHSHHPEEGDVVLQEPKTKR